MRDAYLPRRRRATIFSTCFAQFCIFRDRDEELEIENDSTDNIEQKDGTFAFPKDESRLFGHHLVIFRSVNQHLLNISCRQMLARLAPQLCVYSPNTQSIGKQVVTQTHVIQNDLFFYYRE